MRSSQRAAARQSGAHLSQEVEFPLPLRGVMSEVRSAEFSGLHAAELNNLRSDGSSILTPENYTVQSGAGIGYVPFEFGNSTIPILVTSSGLSRNGVSYPVNMTEVPSFGYISSNAIMAIPNVGVIRYDGTAFSSAEYTSGDITVSELDGFTAHQDRAFLWSKGQGLDFYYGDVGAVTGPLTQFPLGRLGNITGTIKAIRSLTVDAGHGMNDVLAIFTSTGQIITYEGVDPGDALDWRQQARIKVAPVISENGFVEVGSDLWMLTGAGVVSVQGSLRQGSLALIDTITDTIQDDLVEKLAEGGNWSMHLSADSRRVFINRVFNDVSSQYIFHTDSKSFSVGDYPARNWHNEGLITKFTTIAGDTATLSKAGTEKTFSCRWVSSWFRVPRGVGLTYIRPTILANGPLEVKVVILSDHDGTGVDIAESEQTVSIEPDDPADVGGRVSLNEIIGVDAVGEVFQLRMEIAATWAQIVNMKVALQ